MNKPLNDRSNLIPNYLPAVVQCIGGFYYLTDVDWDYIPDATSLHVEEGSVYFLSKNKHMLWCMHVGGLEPQLIYREE